MAVERKPYQGIWNVLRFNWHFYFVAALLLLGLLGLHKILPSPWSEVSCVLFWVMGFLVIASLFITFLVYDCSKLYDLAWLDRLNGEEVLNVHSGFDEVSEILLAKCRAMDLTICDFYDPKKHTEVSIKRARVACPPHSDTLSVTTDHLPFANDSFDRAIAFLSAHEIRNREERISFFRELARVTKPSGQIFVTEHLRDGWNFAAYTIGFLHFHSRTNWLSVFKEAKLELKEEIKTTPFIITFVLTGNGNTA